ncbi:unnamed protein product (macronuclear) [Paramecium tetraurelia]|uniref:Sulphur transport domain-containing protein n=1 Tax=Paramecium tetraurelia TaxID=5888 RepID=A0CXE3_PARTE|nr:uncharacterized protein GSPATT00011092001 [Paramecium tetraurelia]CAK75460.1 unnamed protein product [Paramecium tetraurelia]|eukprot:XP_001442857.1 hypothetical protein (macronuclear) [Paramecium tetraurelia strain d4-2]
MIINISDLFLGFIGGIMIGVACSMYYITKGRITGISGIYYGVITFNWSEFYWKLSVLCSIVFATGLMYQVYGDERIMESSSLAFNEIPQITSLSTTLAGISGLLIGIGSKLCNGCTTSHGFCGLARISLRSFVAFSLFILFGMISSYITMSEHKEDGQEKYNYNHVSIIMIGLSLVLLSGTLLGAYLNKDQFIDTVVGIPAGLLLGIGVVFSGMIKRTTILSFLSVEQWNPQFLFVILGANLVCYFGFKLLKKPIFAAEFLYPPTNKVTNILLIGASLFGFGWGMTGICPFVGLALFPQFTWQIGLMYLGSVSMGMRIAQCYLNKYQKVQDQVIQINSNNYNYKTENEQNDQL